VEEEPTCGRGLAPNTVVPSALAAVAAGLAQNLEVHTRALDAGDTAAAQEQAVYERIAQNLRSAGVRPGAGQGWQRLTCRFRRPTARPSPSSAGREVLDDRRASPQPR
jgi:hypothetical protein